MKNGSRRKKGPACRKKIVVGKLALPRCKSGEWPMSWYLWPTRASPVRDKRVSRPTNGPEIKSTASGFGERNQSPGEITAMSEDTTTERLQHALDRLNAGDNKARNDLIDFVAKRVGRIAGSMLRGHAVHRWEETGDLQQAALIRLNHYLSGDTPTSANHFLCLARWHTRNALRDMARHYFGPEGMGANHSTDGKGRDEGKPRVEQKRAPGDFVNRMMVLELIQNLPPEERKTVDFLFFDGLSQKEVAAELGKGVRSVKRLWQKAKLQLRAWMIGEESGQLARADVGEKLLDWEEGVERGQPASAEELCQTCPELKDELQRNIDALKAMSWMDE